MPILDANETASIFLLKLPACRLRLPGKEIVYFLAPLIPACKAVLAGQSSRSKPSPDQRAKTRSPLTETGKPRENAGVIIGHSPEKSMISCITLKSHRTGTASAGISTFMSIAGHNRLMHSRTCF
jgi:hypothetical protein